MRWADVLSEVLDELWFSRAGSWVRDALRTALGLLSPTWCSGCGEQDTVLCAECAQDLHLLTRSPFAAERQALALPLIYPEDIAVVADVEVGEDGEISEVAQDGERDLAESLGSITVLPVTAAARYAGLASRVLLAYKDHAAIGLSVFLAPGMIRSVHEALERVGFPDARAPGAEPVRWVLLGPPSSLRSRLSRGFDPLQRLFCHGPPGSAAEVRHGDLRLKYLTGVLRQSPVTALRSLNPRGGKQKSRGALARRRELSGAFQVTKRGRQLLAGADVVLVDDVLTSGSTLAELYRVSQQAGGRVHAAAVLAAAPSPGSGEEFPLVSASPEA